jgi:putative transcriptional regulator
MPFSFNPLWKVLIDRKMTREDLRTALKLSPSTMAKMSKGENVSMEVIHKICDYLNVTLDDVVEFIPTKKE